MHKHRLDKLAKLTKGAALVGIGALFACRGETHTNGPAPMDAGAFEPIHTNAPYVPSSAPASASAAPTASIAPSASVRHVPHINAPPHVNAPPAPFPGTINTVTAEPK